VRRSTGPDDGQPSQRALLSPGAFKAAGPIAAAAAKARDAVTERGD
jgi:hypothetical protein